VKDLEMHGCELPDKFVAGCMIAKLPPWTEFATSLKHKRQEFDVAQLIGTLDVEDKARAKDVRETKLQRMVLVHMWCKRIVLNHRRRKTSKM
jgi:hypothetical protein